MFGASITATLRAIPVSSASPFKRCRLLCKARHLGAHLHDEHGRTAGV
jgi:hypothetical protein